MQKKMKLTMHAPPTDPPTMPVPDKKKKWVLNPQETSRKEKKIRKRIDSKREDRTCDNCGVRLQEREYVRGVSLRGRLPSGSGALRHYLVLGVVCFWLYIQRASYKDTSIIREKKFASFFCSSFFKIFQSIGVGGE